MTIEWETPDGLKKETNDMEATVKYCESMGWKQKGGKKKKEPKKGWREPEAAE